MSDKNKSIVSADDLRSVWKIIARNWYILLFFLAASGVFSYLYTYKMDDVYGASTSILLKSEPTYDLKSSIFQGVGYYSGYEQISNQMRVIKSADIIEETLDRLDLGVSYYIKGRFKTKEYYRFVPFKVKASVSSEYYETPFGVKILNGEDYQLTVGDSTSIHKFGERVAGKGYIIQVLKSRYLKDQILQGKKPVADYEFRVHSKGTLITNYKSSINVSNEDWTAILKVTVSDGIPERAVAFLDTLSSIYLDYTLHTKIKINENTSRYIDFQLRQLSDILTEIDVELENYREQEQILDLDKEQQEYFQKLVEFESEKDGFEFKLSMDKALKNYIVKNQQDEDSELLPPGLYFDKEDPFLTRTLQELYAMQVEIANAKFNVKELSTGIEEVRRKISNLRKDLLDYLDNREFALRERIRFAENQIELYEGLIRKLPKTQRQMLAIERRRQVNEKMYLYLLEKKAENNLAKASIVPETKVIEKARTMGVIGPDKKDIIIKSLMAGGGLAFLIIFIRVVAFSTIDSARELKSLTRNPILGEIPTLAREIAPYLVVDEDPKSLVAEAFRSLRTNLEYMAPEVKSKVVLISSYIAGEGKTFCTVNLGAILAKAGKKVILLELDMHKPRIHTGLGMTSDNGLSSILIGKADLFDSIQRSEVVNMDVVLCGPIPPNASELVLSPRLNQVIEELKSSYDYIIVDTPPIGLMTDAVYLMKYSDINLFVLNASVAKRGVISHVHELQEQNNPKNLAFVVNGVKKKRSRYYYYKYKYGYGYGQSYSYGDST